MHHVLTLISPAHSAPLRARVSLLNQLRARLNPVRTAWMSEEACDFLLERRPTVPVMQEIHALAGEQKLDTVLQPIEHRQKKLLVADMDSTMINQECLDELADLRGLKPQVAAITERAMRGEIDFAAALRERVALLKGLTRDELKQVYRERITPMAGAKTLIATLKHRGVKTLLVSGGFRFFTARVGEALGFDDTMGNRFGVRNGVLSGTVPDPILDKHAKRTALIDRAQRLRIPLPLTLAVGDGANDIPMLQTAGIGIAYHAKPLVEALAPAHIKHGDLTALLYLQGIAKRDWK